MAEDSWLKCEREYFSETYHTEYGLAKKKVDEILEDYNKFLQKALIGDSPFVAEDLKNTMVKSGGESDRNQKDTGSGESDKQA